MRSRLVLILCVLLITSHPLARAQESTPSLPADLILTTGGSFHFDNQLIWVNAQTLEAELFYDDNNADQVVALEWSPQGDLLIIHRTYLVIDAPDEHDLCTITREGQLLSCFVESPAYYPYFPDVYSGGKSFPISWSADGQSVYFPAWRKTGAYTGSFALVEADPISGQTIRTLYAYSYDWENGYEPARLTWTDKLDILLVGWGWPLPEPLSEMPMLVDMHTGDITLDAIAMRVSQIVETVAPSSEREYGLSVNACPNLSPQGNYVTLHIYSPSADLDLRGLVVLNLLGDAIAVIGEPDRRIHVMECPVWQADEQAFYFDGVDTSNRRFNIYHYSLPDQQLTAFYQKQGSLLGPLRLSPDEACLLFSDWFSHDTPDKQWVLAWCAGSVLRPGGDELAFTAFPVWIPPLTGTPRMALNIGEKAVVQVMDDTLNVRSCAGADCEILEKLDNGVRVTVLEGPQVSDNYNWWRISTPNGIEGWSVAGADGIQTLVAE